MKANDPVASIFGAFGKFINANELTLNDIKHVMITGLVLPILTNRFMGSPLQRWMSFRPWERRVVPEYFVAGDRVSMGTGTAYIMADEQGEIHMGGTGVGGGTLLGLSIKC